jgi:2-C-methyl-D-erythritol 4-phosphate cytidylyltransferase
MKVHILPGSYTNIKITTPEDLILANLFLRMGAPTQQDQKDRREDG